MAARRVPVLFFDAVRVGTVGRYLAGVVLHVVWFGTAMLGCLLIPLPASEDYSADGQIATAVVVVLLFAGAGASALAAHRLTSRVVPPDNRATLSFDPEPGATWLPRRYWLELPDPVPHAPRPASWPTDAAPLSDVPPDALLRRLWLIRAELADHNRHARFVYYTVRGAFLPTAVGFITGFMVYAIVLEFDDWAVLSGLLPATAISAWATLWALHRWGALPGVRRAWALMFADRRLARQDRVRPGGPLGGPPVPYRGLWGEWPYRPPDPREPELSE